jgi:catechol 2,3-dioxygenase-like lactoylglutathione lyase family enzyme
MTVLHLDHINIRTACLPESIVFYRDVLGMDVRPPPMTDDMSRGAYVHDASGRAIVHLVATDKVVTGAEPVRGAAQRGMVDHFALHCAGHADYVARLTARGVEFSLQEVPVLNMTLIFLRDPNGVLIELNFPL